MLDAETKKSLNKLYDILLGQFPVMEDRCNRIIACIVYKYMSSVHKLECSCMLGGDDCATKNEECICEINEDGYCIFDGRYIFCQYGDCDSEDECDCTCVCCECGKGECGCDIDDDHDYCTALCDCLADKGYFFTGEYERYSWRHIMDSKKSIEERVKLFNEGIEKMRENPIAPSILRQIPRRNLTFPLPIRNPKMVESFLKEIDEVYFSDIENFGDIGDAYEYLLYSLGAQLTEESYMTPQHIADFITGILKPQKNETVLDPACGTGNFLVSAYKYIRNHSTDIDLGISENIVGYDIDPQMVAIASSRLSLCKLNNPRVLEHDTIASDRLWGEKYDVILANPPFGIIREMFPPHSKFKTNSINLDVLFTDYIMEHLTENGRAGIVVPDGIIFRTGNAYKMLRKKLVEDCLVGVISLPKGVFQPYSGVKTSILILDKKWSRQTDRILFAKVENDGFSLDVQRTYTCENDIPKTIRLFHEFYNDPDNAETTVSKQDILASGNFSLRRA